MGTSNLREAVPVGTPAYGPPVPIARAYHVRGVFLATGRHRLEFRYRQPGVFVGLGITLVTLAALTRTR